MAKEDTVLNAYLCHLSIIVALTQVCQIGQYMTKTSPHIRNDYLMSNQNHIKNVFSNWKKGMLWTMLAQKVNTGIIYNKEDTEV